MLRNNYKHSNIFLTFVYLIILLNKTNILLNYQHIVCSLICMDLSCLNRVSGDFRSHDSWIQSYSSVNTWYAGWEPTTHIKKYFSNKLTFDTFETFADFQQSMVNKSMDLRFINRFNLWISGLSIDYLRSVGNTRQPWCDHEEKYFIYFFFMITPRLPGIPNASQVIYW